MSNVPGCVICYEEYSHQCPPSEIPVVLPCGHTFHRSCIQCLTTCPLCRHSFQASKVHPNFTLIELLSSASSKTETTKITPRPAPRPAQAISAEQTWSDWFAQTAVPALGLAAGVGTAVYFATRNDDRRRR
eukprot:TRINITY_DN7181_c0_g1_i1.p1 TRINITY_DN7181_c0_g1~~TRINITY_DN7181_c0_g1_i1.p1  ORF type:complete len:147 (-),score=14.95 TRINITY_DN7181_c0_g1_i1:203-595(-)